ncbi:MAG: hypothetical protein KR126chlam3_00604 [Chlamydiae bacterium]|nr:hypothetical protein [Chlamydiota bacterium]
MPDYKISAYERNCSICFEGFTKSNKPFGHPENGRLHPLHKGCWREWYQNKSSNHSEGNLWDVVCPVCQTPTDVRSLFSRFEIAKYTKLSAPLKIALSSSLLACQKFM